VNPAKLIAGLARHLPENVTVYHQTPALAMRQENGGVRVTTLQGTIRADQAMLATNALSRELSPTVSRQASMATYASITAPLTPEQRQRLPAMESWGLTPVNAIAGATLRYTHDHRFLVRQHVDPALRGVITAGQTASAARQHLALFHAPIRSCRMCRWSEPGPGPSASPATARRSGASCAADLDRRGL
jgi:glycine/D-amino acid oxidase-like deaminating enzyme